MGEKVSKVRLGYIKCHAGGVAEVFRMGGKRLKHLYAKCECCGLNQGTGAENQKFLSGFVKTIEEIEDDRSCGAVEVPVAGYVSNDCAGESVGSGIGGGCGSSGGDGGVVGSDGFSVGGGWGVVAGGVCVAVVSAFLFISCAFSKGKNTGKKTV